MLLKYILIKYSIDGTFLPWSLDLRKHLLSSYPLSDGVIPHAPDAILPFKYHLVLVSLDQENKTASSFHPAGDHSAEFNMNPKLPYERKPCSQLKEQHPSDHHPIIDLNIAPNDRLPIPGGIVMKLVQNARIPPESHWQDVRKLTFITDKGRCGRPGRRGAKWLKDVY